MGELNVNPADLVRAAEGYSELAARAAMISRQAAVEVQRIARTHGPMGYPTAVGITAGLANAEGPLVAKAADFTTYSQRFTEHAGAYPATDAENAARYKAIDEELPNAHVGPRPTAPAPYACVLGSKGNDPKVICGDMAAPRLWYVEAGNFVSVEPDTGRTVVTEPGERIEDTCLWLAGPPTSADIAAHPSFDFWWAGPGGQIQISRWGGGKHLYDTYLPLGLYWGD